MAGPPDNIPPSDLYQRLIQMPRPHRMVDFPRKAPGSEEPIGKLAMWPLRENELLQAQAAAANYVHQNLQLKWGEHEPDHGYREVYNNSMTDEVLQRACRRAKFNEETNEWEPQLALPLFAKSADLRAAMEHNEIGVLFNEYVITQRELGPIVHDLSDAECDAWIDRLIQGGQADGLPFLSWGALIDLVRRSVDRIKSLTTDTSSAGSPPESITTDSTSDAIDPNEPA